MGSPADEAGRGADERAHPVTLTRRVGVGAREVDQALWAEVTGANPSSFDDPEHPVEGVSWLDAVAFCNALSAHEGLDPAYVIAGTTVTWSPAARGFRLPTEAEWEAAARAGSPARFAGANQAEPVAWFGPRAGGSPHPVGTRAPNALGLSDMSGNVSEWVWDRYAAYPPSDAQDPAGPDAGAARVHRGGSWDTPERTLRVAARQAAPPDTRSASVGLRLARTLE
jgi:formylglycine-generating enzyme required for sulfatase activity